MNPDMNISLQGKRAFMTAGGTGMGRSSALVMKKLGAQAFTCDVDEDALSTLPRDIETL
jgi:NAD(P)-dependent dehydrogenase (short-subunit alcohol dehydrogenase family)